MIVSKEILTPQHIQSTVALGFFDGVHLAHRAVIGRAVLEARNRGLTPCVFTFDPQGAIPAGKSGMTLLQTEEQKDRILEEIGVERIFCPDFKTFKMLEPRDFVEQVLIENLGARVLVCGYNYHFGKGASGGVEDLRRLCQPFGVEVVAIEPVLLEGEVVSSTRIRKAVKDGNMEIAHKLLGSAFTIEFPAQWQKLYQAEQGWILQQTFSSDFTVPKAGTYESKTFVGDRCYTGTSLIKEEKPAQCITRLLNEEIEPQKQVAVLLMRRLL